MAKNTTPSFVVTRRIVTDDRGYDKLNKIMRITERMYNAGVRHCSELPASKEAGFRRNQSKDTGFEPAGSLFSCLSG